MIERVIPEAGNNTFPLIKHQCNGSATTLESSLSPKIAKELFFSQYLFDYCSYILHKAMTKFQINVSC